MVLLVRTCLGALWLPLGLTLVFVAGDFPTGVIDQLALALTLWFFLMWLLGLPLALAVLLIYQRSRMLAWATALICAPVSIFFYYLSVPLPSFLNTLFGAVLAWLALAMLYLALLTGKAAQALWRSGRA